MRVIRTSNPDVFVFEPHVFGDERGYFLESFRQSWFEQLGIETRFVQSNHSRSKEGVLRGLHYQKNKPQGKLVRVTTGEVFDVAVDLRRSSPYFGKYVSAVLSQENKRLLWVPPGFAHGFLVVSEYAELQYQCTTYYAPDDEHSLLWNDKTIGINWPLPDNVEITLSEKDKAGKSLESATTFP